MPPALAGESGSNQNNGRTYVSPYLRSTSGVMRFRGEPGNQKLQGGCRPACYSALIFQDPFASLNPVHNIALSPQPRTCAWARQNTKEGDGADTGL